MKSKDPRPEASALAEKVRSHVRDKAGRRGLPDVKALLGCGASAVPIQAWLAAVVVAADAKAPALAARAMKRAESACAKPAQRLELARFCCAIGRHDRVRAAARLLLRGKGVRLSHEAWLELSRVAGEAGDKASASAALERGLRAASGPDELRQAAMRYQNLKDYGRSLRLLDRLVERHPRNGVFFSDRGVLRWLMGDQAGALSDLAKARRLDPANLETAMSLGSALVAAGREAEALALYDSALAGQPDAASSGVGKLMAVERAKLAALRRAPASACGAPPLSPAAGRRCPRRAGPAPSRRAPRRGRPSPRRRRASPG